MVKDVLDRATLVMGGTVLTDMLNAPVAELAMCEYVHFPQYFFNRRSLLDISIRGRMVPLWDSRILPSPPQRSFRKYSELPSSPSLLERPHATFHVKLRSL